MYKKAEHKNNIDILITIIFLLFFTFMVTYIYGYENDKHEKLTVTMEIETIKKLAESNSVNDRINQENVSYYDQNITG